MNWAVRSDRGFSAIEALLATFFGLIAASAFGGFVIAQMHGMRGQARQVDLQASARSILDLFASEARRAGLNTNPGQLSSNPACTGSVSTGLRTGSATQINFRADLNKNGSVEEGEDLTYTLDTTANQVTRKDASKAGSADVLWSGLSLGASRFRYYDLTGAELAPGSTGLSASGSLRNVVRVRLELVLSQKSAQPRSAQIQTVSESTEVTLRNRYFQMSSSCTCGQGCWLN